MPADHASTALTPLRRTDWIVAALLSVATILYVFGHVHFPINPMEDASMLLRYSQNVARGHGIVWNVGEHPVEGATDFLFMIAIGGLSWLTKVSVKSVAATILFVSHVASVAVLYLGLRRLYNAPLLVAAGFAAVLGAGLGYHFISTGFSPPFYSLFALLTWYVGMLCVQDGVTWRRAIWFGTFAFVTGLIRPDGVILAGFMLCSTVYGVRAKRWPLVISFGVIFAVLGGIYFGWRLRYFGYPLPNPFYIKHTSGPDLPTLKISLRLFVEMMLPFLPLAGLGFRSRAALRQLTIWLITVIPFTSVWMIMSLDNNHFSRFQYVIVPLSLLSLGGLLSVWWREVELERPDQIDGLRRPLAWVLVLLFGFAIFYNMHLYKAPFSNVGGQQLAERLRPYAAKHYTMMVTEAGDIPFYSEWRAIDAFGLNDEYIAHHNGVMTEAYLEQNKPEIILYRDLADAMRAADLQVAATGHLTTNNKLILNSLAMRNYAIAHGYVLAAKWGAVYCDYHTYWVRKDFPDSDAIVSAIRDHPYYTQVTGQLSYDFRNVPDPTLPCTLPAE